jgi:hypothetical protein
VDQNTYYAIMVETFPKLENDLAVAIKLQQFAYPASITLTFLVNISIQLKIWKPHLIMDGD